MGVLKSTTCAGSEAVKISGEVTYGQTDKDLLETSGTWQSKEVRGISNN
jgi:hypothetical protein